MKASPGSTITISSLLATALTAGAVTIAIPNGSFESPVTTNFTQFNTDTPGVSGTWERAGGFAAVIRNNGGANVYNYAPTGSDGSQYGNLTGVTGGMMFQDTAPYDNSGSPTLYWQQGTYTLTTGVFLRQGNAPNTGRQMDMRFFYRSADQGAANLLAGDTLTVGIDTLSTSVINDHLLSYTVGAGAPEIGKPIGLWFIAVAGGAGATGDWGLENLRLDFTPVPEPSAGLLGLFSAALLLRRRR